MNGFRVLLAEDDPISREFLIAGLRECGVDVTACANGNSALALARAGGWNLLLLDHHLPELSGAAVLAALRTDGTPPPAIAITADPDDGRAELLHAGFNEVLPKPLALAELRAAVQRYGADDAALDDDDALRACGSAQAVARLRRLFVEQELPAVLAEAERCRDNLQELRPTLHRLRASCGFCGARALGRASATLHRSLAGGGNAGQVQAALDAFLATLAATRAALRDQLDKPG